MISTRTLALYERLPEAYQAILGLDPGTQTVPAQRASEDRLAAIAPIVRAVPRPAKVLDIGCAQGFFTLALEQLENVVAATGVDNLADNIAFCEALAEDLGSNARFYCANADEALINEWLPAAGGVVLLLNVLHHICTSHGWPAADQLLCAVARKADVCIIEVATATEQLGWTRNLPEKTEDWFRHFSFTSPLGHFGTHIPGVARELYVCSNKYAWAEAKLWPFTSSADRSHSAALDVRTIGRKYFFGDALLIKHFSFANRYRRKNWVEFHREVAFLRSEMPESLHAVDVGSEVGVLVRRLAPGNLLSKTPLPVRRQYQHLAHMIGSELARLEKRGFFHADLRPWNVLINEGVPSLIDFGALTRRKRLRVYEDYASLCLWIASDCWRTPLEWLSRIDSIDPFSRGILLAVARANNRDLSFEWLLSAALGSVSIEPRAGRIELSDDFVWSSAENFRRLEAGRRIIERSRAQAVKHAQALEGLVAQKDVYARSLEQQVAALQKSAANQLAAVARERDDGLAQLSALQVAVEAKDADLAAMQGALMQAQSKLEKISAHAGALEQAIRQKDDYARVLLGEIERKQQDAAAQIRELVRERDDGAAQVAALNAAIGQKDAEIADLAAYVAGATRDRDLVLADLAAARDELEAVTDEVAKACRSFDRETHTVWQADEPDDENAVHSGNMVDEARSLFAERSAQRRASRSLGLELDRAFAAARDLVERKSLRIDELNAQCSALTTEIQSVREQLQLTECRFADLRARLAEHWLFKLTGLPKALK